MWITIKMFNFRYSPIRLNSNIMKKISSMALLGLSLMGFSQVKIGVKANVLLNTSSSKWSEIKRSVIDYTDSGSKSAGFNVGLSARVNLPSTPLFIMPEIYYTSFNNSFTERRTKTTLKAKTNRIDVPVLVGVNLISDNLGVFVGPVASYNLAKENTWNNFKENAGNKFTVGYQVGAEARLSNFIINARYEGSFSKDQRDFINNNISETVRYDNRPSFVVLGVGYEF